MLKSGEHKDRLDVKKKCISPLVSAVRVLSLEARIPQTSTLERLAALRGRSRIVDERGEELAQAFEFLLLLRIHHQIEQVGSGAPPDDFIDPNALSNLQKKIFREVCQTLSAVQEAVARGGHAPVTQ